MYILIVTAYLQNITAFLSWKNFIIFLKKINKLKTIDIDGES